jgi:hypothetical protein
MTRRSWIISAAMLLIGLVIGGGGVEGYHRFYTKKAQELFSQRLRCKGLADHYVKQQSTDSMTVILYNVDYSTTSNSCIGYFHVLDDVHREHYLTQDITSLVTDLLTGEELYQDHCVEDRNCGGGNDFRIMNEAKSAFDEAVNGKKSNRRK